ncbi:TetR/AcrR family transcriptional regulator [Janthinobacterium agaricidamnosum]|uniref:Bacterial regulatory s, tetR family protein n=1 Tax=Janthinobacterium agaricidamnosum NBRC 102515 = DSM 9628 TaxID=1349767 RepID=W0V5E9_9BURK|nr:TetR/AcrR family transcriptional regulator [Janthinobacterium agaricidamnosum]CDG84049.1 bacterial regulatory s, tetR family protein [Janthinobacterium agaricidamnosum NBRC 102515 = DSM 9628]
MKVSKEKAAENKAVLIRTAARLFREHGIDGVGVAEIARSAGLTHGALYAHFPSKEALVAAALADGMARNQERLEAGRNGAPLELASLLESYLSGERRDNLAVGCTIAASASEIGRQDEHTSACFSVGFEEMTRLVEATLVQDLPAGAARQRALAITAAMIGGIAVARGAAKARPELSDEILAAVRRQLLELGLARPA